jgi:protein tyrosine phosphatase (PTP) superfamily phosphohydrolase (DUF442 family)
VSASRVPVQCRFALGRRPRAAPRGRHIALALAALGVLVALPSSAQRSAPFAPNVVEVSPRLVTSGQPPEKGLSTLGALGFEAVIYLAPPTVSDAVRDEAYIVGRQGLVFVDIPIQFDRPTEQDYETFAGVLDSLGARKVLVHCQVNLRASSMVFLYRVIARKEDPDRAYGSVTAVWSPEGPWKRLIQELLRKHNVKFDLY